MGGFGWAACQVARIFQDRSLGVDVVFLTGELRAKPAERAATVHGTRLLLRQPSLVRDVRHTRAEQVDLLLLIDYRPNYRHLCWTLPRTPMIVWVRDPRPPDDVRKVHALRIPGANGVRPKGTFQPECASLGTIVRASRWLRRPVLFASPAPHLRDKASATFRVDVGELALLPNPVELAPGHVLKSERPRVVFLARLDPYKRPWLFAELARRFPQVEFFFAGQAHYHGEGAWEPAALPPNVRLLGHIDEPEKQRLLSSAWALVNTSIHEGGVAVAFLEALACETPLVATVECGGIVSRFGLYAGRFDGAGLDALPGLARHLDHLLSRADLRRRLGQEGRLWVEETHNRARFLDAFWTLCARAGLRR
jgi:glycosyltransferase involved in cell wall biosynthesis